MTNTYSSFLITILLASSACLASTQSQSSVAIITGEIREPTSREIAFSYQPPSAIGSAEERVVLDSLNRFALEIPVVRGALARGHYEGGQPRWKWMQWIGYFLFDRSPFIFFVEPGDSLHIVVEEGFFGPSYSFSGPNADNSRFMAELFPRLRGIRLDYEDLKVEDFSRQADQWLQDQFSFLAEGREEYALSPIFVDYATAYFNYGWARLMISYPTEYRFANHHENRDLPPEYYDFLQEIPLVDEKAIGVGNYNTFLLRTLDWESEVLKPPRQPREAIGPLPSERGELGEGSRPSWQLSEVYDLSGLELSEETLAQLDALYEKEGQRPKLSQMVDLSAVGLLSATQARLDSMYKKKRPPKLSHMLYLSAFGLSQTAQAELDSFFERNGRSYTTISSGKEAVARVDTTDGALMFFTPINVQMESFEKTPKLSEEVNLSGIDLSEATQAQLDSMYEHRQPLKLSEEIDLSSLGLSEATRAQLDSIYADTGSRIIWSFSKRYNLAKEKLEGRVLYWFLAGELISGFERGGSEAFALAQRKWEDFQQINPHPEYTEAVRAVLDKVLKLQPGQPAPEFILDDLDGQPVSLSQFKGQVVLLDFWASWCGPCISDLPDLRRIKEKTAALPVVFLNISLDADEAAWREAIDRHEIKGVHMRANGFSSDVAKSYQVTGIPSYYLVDSQGLILENPIIRDTDEIVAMIEKSL